MNRALLLVCMMLGLGGCRASESECARLLDHFVDVEGNVDVAGRFHEITPQLMESIAREKRIFRDELSGSFIGRCHAQLSSAEVSCALKATDEPGLDQCQGR